MLHAVPSKLWKEEKNTVFSSQNIQGFFIIIILLILVVCLPRNFLWSDQPRHKKAAELGDFFCISGKVTAKKL